MFSKNRDRLLEGNIAARFLAAVLDQPRVKKLLSTEHFTVDGTLIEAWASLKSLSHGTDRTSRRPVAAQYRSRFPRQEAVERDACLDDDPDARLYRKGPGRKPSSTSSAMA